MIFGLLATDIFTMLELEKLRTKDLEILKKAGINTIYGVADIPIDGIKRTRGYVGPGRTKTTVTKLLVDNIRFVASCGFQIMIVLGNEPSVRYGLSSQMAGRGYRKIWWPRMLYNTARLEKEKACWSDLLDKVGDLIFAGALYLEPSARSSILFCQQLAMHIRKLGFKGDLYSNGIRSARWDGDRELGVYSAASINSLKDWQTSDQDLKNADGMVSLTEETAAVYLPQMTSNPGPKGLILWYDDYRGGISGPGVLKKWHTEYLRFPS